MIDPLRTLADRGPCHRDRNKQPDPYPCATRGCEALMPWRWYEYKGRRLRPKWLEPPFDTCAACRAGVEFEKQLRAYRARQEAAGIPDRYRAYSFDETRQLNGAGESPIKLWCRTNSVVGITDGNRAAYEFLRDWRPGDGSAWLWGEKGGGKSCLASVLGNKLLRPGGETREVEGGLAVNLPKQVLFTSDELLKLAAKQAIDDSKAGRDDAAPDPVRRLIAADIVIYDDIGTHTGKWLTELRESVVNGRYMRTAPTIFTGHRSPIDSAELFSPRMIDRFAEMFDNGLRVFPMRDANWRTS